MTVGRNGACGRAGRSARTGQRRPAPERTGVTCHSPSGYPSFSRSQAASTARRSRRLRCGRGTVAPRGDRARAGGRMPARPPPRPPRSPPARPLPRRPESKDIHPRRSWRPIWGAASPYPGAASFIANIEATSARSSSVPTVTGTVAWRGIGSPRRRIGRSGADVVLRRQSMVTGVASSAPRRATMRDASAAPTSAATPRWTAVRVIGNVSPLSPKAGRA